MVDRRKIPAYRIVKGEVVTDQVVIKGETSTKSPELPKRTLRGFIRRSRK